jgi:hypothetical protein
MTKEEEQGWKDLENLMTKSIEKLQSLKPKEDPADWARNWMLSDLLKVLGWQGGTIHQVVEEIKNLKEKEARLAMFDEGTKYSLKKVTFVKSELCDKGEAVMLIHRDDCRYPEHTMLYDHS